VVERFLDRRRVPEGRCALLACGTARTADVVSGGLHEPSPTVCIDDAIRAVAGVLGAHVEGGKVCPNRSSTSSTEGPNRPLGEPYGSSGASQRTDQPLTCVDATADNQSGDHVTQGSLLFARGALRWGAGTRLS